MFFEQFVLQLLLHGTDVARRSVLARETGVSIKPRVPTLGLSLGECLRAREAGDRDLAIRLSPVSRALRF
jgi:hypothetical protein